MEEDEVPREGKGFTGFFPVDADAEEDIVKDGCGEPKGESAEESSFTRGFGSIVGIRGVQPSRRRSFGGSLVFFFRGRRFWGLGLETEGYNPRSVLLGRNGGSLNSDRSAQRQYSRAFVTLRQSLGVF